MARKYFGIDGLLKEWAFYPGAPLVRRIAGRDGRDLLQMRVDLGILQLEATGRPDGQQPHGFATYYDYLVAAAFDEGAEFALDATRCGEIDREFYQYYHRRICWLTLKEYRLAAEDADHSLRLMDFTSANSPDRHWAQAHEQYRPFVMFHRIQAAALLALEESKPTLAVERLDEGMRTLADSLRHQEAEVPISADAYLEKLHEMRTSIVDQFHVGPSLAQQLADAIAAEQYERAAKLRDRLRKRKSR